MRTFRRTLLDEALTQRAHLMAGRVLDIGGKKLDKRGRFRPESTPASSWEYLNVDPETDPDFLCSADAIPVDEEVFDAVVMSEVLEHLIEPEAALAEARRVLKPGGRLLATMPFLFPVHGDPEDYQRWTRTRFEVELGRAGLVPDEVSPMGSVIAVLFDLCWIAWNVYLGPRHPWVHRLASLPFIVVKPLARMLDRRARRLGARMHTGYVVVARKPG